MAAPVESDDWLFSSLKRYKILHVYDLQQPTRVIEWIDEERICVAGCDQSSKRNEILELKIPRKILSHSEGLVKDRDFKVLRGGFCNYPIQGLTYVQDDTCELLLSTSSTDSSVQLWKMGHDKTDVIQSEGTVFRPTEDDLKSTTSQVCLMSGTSFVFGTHSTILYLADLKTGSVSHLFKGCSGSSSVSSKISKMEKKDANQLVTCEENSGRLQLLDIRKHDPVCKTSEMTEKYQHKTKWAFAHQKETAILVNSAGKMIGLDYRDWDKNTFSVHIKDIGLNEDSFQATMCIQFSPTKNNVVSLSGFDGMVYLFDLGHIQTSTQLLSPIFTHEGHVMEGINNDNESWLCSGAAMVKVLTHTWHTVKDDIILSSASDGSLHTWQYQIK